MQNISDTSEQDQVAQPNNSVSNPTSTVEPIKDLEAASSNKAQPVRKISRFLVSPAILTVTNEKSAQNTCVEDSIPRERTEVDINQTAIDFVKQVVDANLGPEMSNASEILNQRYASKEKKNK